MSSNFFRKILVVAVLIWSNYLSAQMQPLGVVGYHSGSPVSPFGVMISVALCKKHPKNFIGGAAIPHIRLAQSTKAMDWKNIEWVVYSTGNAAARGLVCLPSDNVLHAVSIINNHLASDPYNGSVQWNIHAYNTSK
jgi:hypothetical protein